MQVARDVDAYACQCCRQVSSEQALAIVLALTAGRLQPRNESLNLSYQTAKLSREIKIKELLRFGFLSFWCGPCIVAHSACRHIC